MASPALPSKEELARVEQYLAADPANPRLLVRAVDTALALGELAAARRHVDSAMRTAPGDAYMRHRHAIVLMAESRLEEAAAIFEELRARHAEPDIAYNLALARFKQGKFEDARKALLPVGDATPPHAVTLALRVLHHLDQLRQASAIAQAQMKRCADSAEFLAVASLVFLDADDAATASELAQASLARGPRVTEALVVSGYVALARRDTAAAQTLFNEALHANALEPRSLAGKGIAALLAGDAQGAKLLLEQATRILPDNAKMLQALGWAQVMSQDGAAAEATFARLGAQPDSRGEANGGLAVARAMRGRRAEAAQALAQLDAGDPAAQMAKAMLDGDPQALAKLRELAVRGLRR